MTPFVPFRSWYISSASRWRDCFMRTVEKKFSSLKSQTPVLILYYYTITLIYYYASMLHYYINQLYD